MTVKTKWMLMTKMETASHQNNQTFWTKRKCSKRCLNWQTLGVQIQTSMNTKDFSKRLRTSLNTEASKTERRTALCRELKLFSLVQLNQSLKLRFKLILLTNDKLIHSRQGVFLQPALVATHLVPFGISDLITRGSV